MSKVPYTINVEEYICSELDHMRKMKDTLDFSNLPSLIERIQFHASSMESALYRQRALINTVRRVIEKLDNEEDDEINDVEQAFNKIRKHVEKYDEDKD